MSKIARLKLGFQFLHFLILDLAVIISPDRKNGAPAILPADPLRFRFCCVSVSTKNILCRIQTVFFGFYQ